MPFLRWLSRDVVQIEEGCDCERRDDPRLIHAGRTLAFFKVKVAVLERGAIARSLEGQIKAQRFVDERG